MGDSHGKWKSFEELIISQNIRDASIWHLGDGVFGLGDRKTDMIIMTRLNDFLLSKNITLFNTRGNHENPYWFKSESTLLKYLEQEDKKVPTWKKEDYYYRYYYINPNEYCQFIKNLSNIKFVKDYDVVTINDLNILSIGGAISIDRKQQNSINGQYFTNEKLSFSNQVYNLKNIDIVASHTTPDFAGPHKFAEIIYHYESHDTNLVYELTQERKLMTKIYQELIKNNNIKLWVYGHYHHHIQDKYDNIDFICLGILELAEFFK
jgi:UDP-2,3-diacylglucosamine pyrophosphatase LpxH